MLKIPVFKRNFLVRPVGESILILLNEHNYVALNGAFYHELYRLVDGVRSLDDIMAELGSSYSLPQIMAKLGNMVDKGYLVERDTTVPDAQAAWWDYLGISPAMAEERLHKGTVSITLLDPQLDLQQTRAILTNAGLNVTEQDGAIDLVLVDDYLNPGVAEINRAKVATGRPWLLARTTGAVLWLGPLFLPPDGACYTCLQARIAANRQMEAFIQRQNPELKTGLAEVAFGPGTHFGLSWLALELSKWLADPTKVHGLHDRIATFDQVNLEQKIHILTKRPQCAVCGDPAPVKPQPIILKSSAIIDDVCGGHRIQTPYATYTRLEKHISSITGIVTHLEKFSKEDNPLLHVYIAGHNFAMLKDDLFVLAVNMRARSGGKGLNDFQARASAVCESIERYCGVSPRGELVRASFNMLRQRKRVLDPALLQGFSASQYAGREAWNAKQAKPGNHRVPEPFNYDREIAWATAWSLTRQEHCYLPASYAYYGHRDEGPLTIIADSNGSAAGNSLEEAMLQALMEVVERDSVAIWWYNRIQRQGVDLDSFGEPYLHQLLDYYRSIDRELWVLDITSDLGIPTFAGVSRRTDRAVEDIVVGFGSHLDPKVALFRALTEVNQFLPSLLEKNADGSTLYKYPDRDAIIWWLKARAEEQAYLLPDPALPRKQFADYQNHGYCDLRDELLHCQDLLEGAGLELIAMDLSHPDIELHVARILVPGMCHFWRRLGHERLYEVPIQMGWLDRRTPEEALNPYSIFF